MQIDFNFGLARKYSMGAIVAEANVVELKEVLSANSLHILLRYTYIGDDSNIVLYGILKFCKMLCVYSIDIFDSKLQTVFCTQKWKSKL